MKRILGLVIAAGLVSVLATAQPDDGFIYMPAERVFIPTGFDDNDQVEIVVDGMLPSSCYEVVAGDWALNPDDRSVTLYPKAIERTGGLCMPVLVPFTQVFNLGVLPMGDYEIKVDGVDTKSLGIAEASNSGPDDVIYASIDNAYVLEYPAQGEHRILLEGNYTSTCMFWDKVELIVNDPSVIEVLPTVRVEDRPDCEDRIVPFKGISVELPDLVGEGRYLLHVRSMNGNSVNRVFSYEPL